MGLLKYAFIILFVLQGALATENAPEQSQDQSYLRDIGEDLISPVSTPARWILLGGAATTAMMYLTRKDITYRKRASFSEAKPLGNTGIVGDYVGYGVLNIAYSSYFLWKGKYQNDPKALKAAEHMIRASAYALAVTQTIKFTVKEKRPGYPDDDHSFPSGHSSASFAFASVVAAQHGWGWGGLAHGAAAFIAISRYNDDFHYLHDITAGITIGASFAWGVYYNLEKGNPYWLTLVPVQKGAGLAMGLEF